MKVYAIAINTFKEVIRDKIFYSLVFFAVLLLGASVLLSTLTLGEQSKIIEDLSLSGIEILGVIIAIFVGIGLVNKELEKKTIYTIISKPIERWQFLLGKYLGLALTLLSYVSVMTVCYMLVLLAVHPYPPLADADCGAPDIRRASGRDGLRNFILHVLDPHALRELCAGDLRDRKHDRRPSGACGKDGLGWGVGHAELLLLFPAESPELQREVPDSAQYSRHGRSLS